MFNWIHRGCQDKLEKEREKLYGFIAARETNIKELEVYNHKLNSQLPTLLGQIKEQKAILEYAMHEKEQHIESLQAQLDGVNKDNSEYMEANEQLVKDNTDLSNKLNNLLTKGKRLTAEFKELHKDKIDPKLPDNEYRAALDKELSWQKTPEVVYQGDDIRSNTLSAITKRLKKIYKDADEGKKYDRAEEFKEAREEDFQNLQSMFDAGVFKNARIVAKKQTTKPKTKRKKK